MKSKHLVPLAVVLASCAQLLELDGDFAFDRGTGGAGASGGGGVGAAGGMGGSAEGGEGGSAGAIDACGICPTGKSCHEQWGCVDCLMGVPSECPSATPHCIAFDCVTCGELADCAGMGMGEDKACDPKTGTCVSFCTDQQACVDAGSVTCDADLMACVECNEETPCAQAGEKANCHPERYTCVACLDHGDCTDASKPACDYPTGTCVTCVLEEHCKSGETCVDQACVAKCASNSNCNNGKLCRVETGKCVECLVASDCIDAAKPICDVGGSCVACTKTEDCAIDQVCEDFACVTPP